uniref:Uncharacterized protein n=1 Tax=Rhizophora mucronata TaxID=61149 RepID=A0A2P2N3F3_RHIMU
MFHCVLYTSIKIYFAKLIKHAFLNIKTWTNELEDCNCVRDSYTKQ